MSSRSSNNSSITTPPEIPEFFRVGWVQSAHGLKGELYVRLNAGEADWLDVAEEIFLLAPGARAEELKGFEIVQLKPHKEGLIARLKGIDNRNASEAAEKSQVYIPEAYLEAEPGDTIFLNQILGFKVVDQTTGEAGEIIGFSSNGPQDLLRIKRPTGAEALIPLVDEFLVEIDFDNKQVTMDLPPGLIDLEVE